MLCIRCIATRGCGGPSLPGSRGEHCARILHNGAHLPLPTKTVTALTVVLAACGSGSPSDATSRRRDVCRDAFAIRLGPDLDGLRYGSYFGGPAHDNGRGALLAEDCSMFLVGASAGAGFPTSNAWQPDFAGGGEQWGNGDAFVVALSPG